jgi:hypothetical protein
MLHYDIIEMLERRTNRGARWGGGVYGWQMRA